MTDTIPSIIKLSELLTQHSSDDWKDVSLCFGHFNEIHPGHLRYFRLARDYGAILAVAVEGDHFSGESSPPNHFPELERAQAVRSLDLIDTVIILDEGLSIEKLIEYISPAALVLGPEFENERFSEVKQSVSLINKLGGRVIYAAGEKHYATANLFYGTQQELEKDRWMQFQKALRSQNIDVSALLNRLRPSRKKNILVLGDTIVDRYVACDPLGLSNEAPIVVVKELETRDFIGGAAIVAAHVSALGAKCTYLSVTGQDNRYTFVKDRLSDFGVETTLVKDSSRPTTFKIRYHVENQKLFRVSKLKDHNLSTNIEELIIDQIARIGPTLDGILVCDFVYGVITPALINSLIQISNDYDIPLFGDLQCSSQIGDVSKFNDFELLCPTEKEARIALTNQDDSIEIVANLLMEKTRAKKMIVKLAADGLIAYDMNRNSASRQHFPALCANPVDLAGAGDSLLAAASVALTHECSLMEAAALGTCAAALAVQTVGNTPIGLNRLEEYLEQKIAIYNAS